MYANHLRDMSYQFTNSPIHQFTNYQFTHYFSSPLRNNPPLFPVTKPMCYTRAGATVCFLQRCTGVGFHTPLHFASW
jgi:hypothetical protein